MWYNVVHSTHSLLPKGYTHRLASGGTKYVLTHVALNVAAMTDGEFVVTERQWQHVCALVSGAAFSPAPMSMLARYSVASLKNLATTGVLHAKGIPPSGQQTSTFITVDMSRFALTDDI